MGKTIMGAVVSLGGFMADFNDEVGPLFDWYGNGDVTRSFPGSPSESRSTQVSPSSRLSAGPAKVSRPSRRVVRMEPFLSRRVATRG
jgi:hypothetical protein